MAKQSATSNFGYPVYIKEINAMPNAMPLLGILLVNTGYPKLDVTDYRLFGKTI